jgi:hypothetical protein
MTAFVKTNNGTFPNVNFFLAWEAFNTMGYSVTCFEEKDIDNLEITTGTPVFAGVTVFRKVIDKLGIDYPPFDCYPEILKPYYKREIRRSTLGVEREKFNKTGERVFIKPVLPKQFIGDVWDSILNLIPLAKIPDDVEVWVCSPISIASEYRVYVHDGDVLGVKHYFGDWSKAPSPDFVKQVVKAYHPCPIAYGVDIGVTDNGMEFVIEANDGCNLGNYGLDSIYYGEMIVARWFEIMASPGIEKQIKEDVERSKENFEKYEWAKEFPQRTEEYYNENFANTGSKPVTMRDCMVKSQTQKLKDKSLKSFADEVQRNLREDNV